MEGNKGTVVMHVGGKTRGRERPSPQQRLDSPAEARTGCILRAFSSRHPSGESVKLYLVQFLVLSVLLLSGRDAGAEETTTPERLRVMTYNIHHGRGTDKEVDLERIAEVIRKAEADVVALQEVDIKTSRSAGIDQLRELERLTGMHGSFAKARNFQGGDYGQAVLSRRPIKSMEVHKLPRSEGERQRIAFFAHISGSEAIPDVLLVGAHLYHRGEDVRFPEAERLLEILKEEAGTTAILVGDLNAEPGSRTMDLVLRNWEDTSPPDALTYPAGNPIKKIDYILLPQGHPWRIGAAAVIDEKLASDHRPVIVDLLPE